MTKTPGISRRPETGRYDAVVVGAGFSGLYMIYKLRQLGLSVISFEAGDGVGGTWYWNRYPGARCDAESLEYSYSFSEELHQEWNWTERFATQPEILRYIEHVADRFDLRRDIRFGTRVTAAHYDEAAGRWQVSTDLGDAIDSRFCIMATGALSAARVPDFPGLSEFAGKTYHTGTWPHEKVDFTGQQVAVIGTGSSGIQVIPMAAQEADHVFVFQRTPNFSIPAWNGPIPKDKQREWKERHKELRAEERQTRVGLLLDYSTRSALDVSEEERQREYESRWKIGGPNFGRAFNDLLVNKEANDTAAEFVRGKIRSIVRDPAVAARLSPTDYPIGTKRVCIDTDYYATFNRDNVTLVDLRETPLETLTKDGLRISDREYRVDSIVFATGYDAMTGPINRIDVRGRDGLELKVKWEAGPRTYLGLMVAGFPNFFIVTGPGSPSVLSNMVVSIEQHVEWISDCLDYLRDCDLSSIEATQEAEDNWVAHVNEVAAGTLLMLANSWYMGANVPGKPRVFMPYAGGVGAYANICKEIVDDGYRGFELSGNVQDASGAERPTRADLTA